MKRSVEQVHFPDLAARQSSCQCPGGASPSCCSAKRCQVPVWLLMVGLSSLSLVLVGVLTYELTLTWSLNSVDYLSVKYRELACATVQGHVVTYLELLMAETSQLAMDAAASALGPGDPCPEELRKRMIHRMQSFQQFPSLNITLPGSAMALGLSTGELFSIASDATTGKLFWVVSNNSTGYNRTMWPATELSKSCEQC
eukprot:RCo052067